MTSRTSAQRLLLFGGTGSIGSAIAGYFSAEGWRVVIVSRSAPADDTSDVPGAADAAPTPALPERGREPAVRWNPLDGGDAPGQDAVRSAAPYDAICWAQGQNCNDSVYEFDPAVHEGMYRANCLYVLASLNFLLRSALLAAPARLCVISSIWQNIARQNKLSYGVTKAALQGLVLSAANDLGRDGHLINAVLPGALDTPMTRRNLSAAQLEKIVGGTQFERLPGLNDVASAVYYLCSEKNTGVTGQFIKVDLGFSDVRVI
jgi:NAD(P)-dependent dehydrogenase (short-subunit alcohol dehydrogenase family)